MKKDIYTLKITLIPRFRNKLKEHSFKKQQNIPRDRSFNNTLIKYEKEFDRKGKNLIECWGEVNRYMEDNVKKLINETSVLFPRSTLGYRYIGYYTIVELDEIESKSINIWSK